MTQTPSAKAHSAQKKMAAGAAALRREGVLQNHQPR